MVLVRIPLVGGSHCCQTCSNVHPPNFVTRLDSVRIATDRSTLNTSYEEYGVIGNLAPPAVDLEGSAADHAEVMSWRYDATHIKSQGNLGAIPKSSF